MVALHGQFNVNLRVDLEPVQTAFTDGRKMEMNLPFLPFKANSSWSALVENVAPGLVYEKCQMILTEHR